MPAVFSLLIPLMLCAPTDTIEWSEWGDARGFLMKYQRSVNDTTLLHGRFETFLEGRLVMKGQFHTRRKDGLWEHFHPVTGKPAARGYYRRGLRNGRWEFYSVDGVLKSTKDYKNGLPAGYHTSYYANGKPRMLLSLRNDTAITEVVLFYPEGDTLLRRSFVYGDTLVRCAHQSYYRKGPRFEAYTFTLDPDHPVIAQRLKWGFDYLADVVLADPTTDYFLPSTVMALDGSYRRFHSNGRQWEHRVYENNRLINVLGSHNRWGRLRNNGDFVNGNGQLIRYADHGDTARVEHYRNGLRHGPARYYEPRLRKRAEGHFLDGKPSGTWLHRGADQSVRLIITYHTPDSATSRAIPKAAVTAHEGSYVNGVRQGKWVFYDYYGDTLTVEHYRQGLPHGPFRQYTLGVLEREGNFIDGVPDGLWHTYNRNGKITWIENFSAQSGYDNELAPPYRLEFDYPVHSKFAYSMSRSEPSIVQQMGNVPWEIVINNRRVAMFATAGRQDGDVVFALDVEDTGHVYAVRSLKSSHPDYYQAALDFVGVMPYMTPATFEGMPRESRAIISFYFDEIR
jgi:antitoxin component YwqK of YwqJK toxin-antitoxin module